MSRQSQPIRRLPATELTIGQEASLTRTLTRYDSQLFAAILDDLPPGTVPPEYAPAGSFHHLLAHSIWGAALIWVSIEACLPASGICLSQDLKILRPISLGQAVTATARVAALDPARRQVLFDCHCMDQTGTQLIVGQALLAVPAESFGARTSQQPDRTLTADGVCHGTC